jgi:hypothetical protein
MTDELMDRMKRFAEMIAPAKYLPQELRGDTASILYVLATGQDLGINWTHAIRSTFTSRDGSIAMKGDVLLALLQVHGFKVDFEFSEKPVGCTCTITRPGGEPVSRTFTMDDAQLIETRWIPEQDRWERLAENYFYHNFGKTMCQWRSLAICGRVAAPDVIGGIYLPDELLADTNTPSQIQSAAGEPEPPADEFVVGEKPAAPVEPEPEPAGNVVVMKPPPETAGDWKGGETWGITEILPVTGTPVFTETWKSEKSAGDRAQGMADLKGCSVYVFRLLDGVVKEPTVYQPAPKAPTPPPAVAPEPAKPLDLGTDPAAEFSRLIGIMRGRIGGEAPDKLIGRYFKSFMNSTAVTKDRAKLLAPLTKLVDASDSVVGDLKADPEGVGLRLSGRSAGIVDKAFTDLKWPAPVRELARKVMKMLGSSEGDFVEWLTMPMLGEGNASVAISSLEPPALEIVFPLFLLVKQKAFIPVQWAISNKRSVTETLTEMIDSAGKPANEWDGPFAEKIFAAIDKVSKPTTAPPEDILDGGLPFN